MRTPVALSVLTFFGHFTLIVSCLLAVLILLLAQGQVTWLLAAIAAAIVFQALIVWAVCEALVLIGRAVLAIYDTLPAPIEPEHYSARWVSATKAARTRT